MNAQAKRWSGRAVVLGLSAVIGAVFLTAVGLWYRGREPKGPILALRAFGDGEAMVVRRGYEARATVHLARYDRAGHADWFEALFSFQEDGPVVVDEGRVAVAAREARGRASTHVFDLEGRFLFRADPPPESVPQAATARLAFAGERLFELYPGEPSVLSAYALDGGERLFRVHAPAGARALVPAEAIWVSVAGAPAPLMGFDPSSGRPVEPPASCALEPDGAGCPPRAGSPPEVEVSSTCVRLRSGSMTVELDRAALAVEGRDASDLILAGGAQVFDAPFGVVARVGAWWIAAHPDGAVYAARIEAPEPIAQLRPEHLYGGGVFLHTERHLVGLDAELTPPRGYDGPIEVSPRPLAVGCPPPAP